MQDVALTFHSMIDRQPALRVRISARIQPSTFQNKGRLHATRKLVAHELINCNLAYLSLITDKSHVNQFAPEPAL